MGRQHKQDFRLEDRVLFEAGAVIQAAEAAAAENNAAEQNSGAEDAASADDNDSAAAESPVSAPETENVLLADPGAAGIETDPALDGLLQGLTQQDGEDRTLVIINSSVLGADDIVAAISEHADVLQLRSGGNALDQINAYLDGKSDVSYAAIHIVSHGNDRSFTLSGESIDSAFLAENRDAFAEIGSHLTDNGDILLYGCDLASTAEGRALAADLAEITGADVAASDDATGAAGDWDLEFTVGSVESDSIRFDNYRYSLATITVTEATSAAVKAAITNAADGDEILLSFAEDTRIEGGYEIFDNKSITINGGGNVTLASSDWIFYAKHSSAGSKEVDIRFEDLSIECTNDNKTAINFGSIVDGGNFSLTLENVDLSSTSANGSAVGISFSCSDLTLIDTDITGFSNQSVYFTSPEGTLTVQGGTIEVHPGVSNQNGKAIRTKSWRTEVDGTVFKITDGTTIRNAAGAIIYAEAGSDSTSVTDGNNLILRNITMQGMKFTGVDTSLIWQTGGTLLVENCRFGAADVVDGEGNVTTYNGLTFAATQKTDTQLGSVLHLINCSDVTIKGTATAEGGGTVFENITYANRAIVGVSGGTNVLIEGTDYVDPVSGEVTRGVQFLDSAAAEGTAVIASGSNKGGSGALGLQDVQLTMDGVLFRNIDATGRGGAVFLYAIREDDSRISDTDFINCSVTGGTGALTDGYAAVGGAIFNYSSSPLSTLLIEDCLFENCSAIAVDGGVAYGGAIASKNAAAYEIRNTVFRGNSASGTGTGLGYGGAFAAVDNDKTKPYHYVNMENVVFENNTADYGGAVFNANHKLIYGEYDPAYAAGGSVSGSAMNSKLSFTDAEFINNTATVDGGAIYAAIYTYWYNSGLVELHNVDFSGNRAGGHGGAIFASAVCMTIENTAFTNNTAGDDGGALYFMGQSEEGASVVFSASYAYSSLAVENTSFENNTAASDGGAIYFARMSLADGYTKNARGYLKTSYFTVENSLFNNNRAAGTATTENTTATGRGGAIYLTDRMEAAIINSTISNNNALTTGGAVYIANTEATTGFFALLNVTTANNTTAATGATYDLQTLKTTEILNSLFAGNTGAYDIMFGAAISATTHFAIYNVFDKAGDKAANYAMGGVAENYNLFEQSVVFASATPADNGGGQKTLAVTNHFDPASASGTDFRFAYSMTGRNNSPRFFLRKGDTINASFQPLWIRLDSYDAKNNTSETYYMFSDAHQLNEMVTDGRGFFRGNADPAGDAGWTVTPGAYQYNAAKVMIGNYGYDYSNGSSYVDNTFANELPSTIVSTIHIADTTIDVSGGPVTIGASAAIRGTGTLSKLTGAQFVDTTETYTLTVSDLAVKSTGEFFKGLNLNLANVKYTGTGSSTLYSGSGTGTLNISYSTLDLAGNSIITGGIGGGGADLLLRNTEINVDGGTVALLSGSADSLRLEDVEFAGSVYMFADLTGLKSVLVNGLTVAAADAGSEPLFRLVMADGASVDLRDITVRELQADLFDISAGSTSPFDVELDDAQISNFDGTLFRMSGDFNIAVSDLTVRDSSGMILDLTPGGTVDLADASVTRHSGTLLSISGAESANVERLTIFDSDFSGATISGSTVTGAPVTFTDNAALTLSDIRISGNTNAFVQTVYTGSYSGAAPEIALSLFRFQKNTNGAFLFDAGGTAAVLSLVSSVFAGNNVSGTSAYTGSLLQVKGGSGATVSVRNSSFLLNTVPGSILDADGIGTLELSGATFDLNEASGAVVRFTGNDMLSVNGTFNRNTGTSMIDNAGSGKVVVIANTFAASAFSGATDLHITGSNIEVAASLVLDGSSNLFDTSVATNLQSSNYIDSGAMSTMTGNAVSFTDDYGGLIGTRTLQVTSGVLDVSNLQVGHYNGSAVISTDGGATWTRLGGTALTAAEVAAIQRIGYDARGYGRASDSFTYGAFEREGIVAYVNGTGYTAIATAITAAGNGGTVEIVDAMILQTAELVLNQSVTIVGMGENSGIRAKNSVAEYGIYWSKFNTTVGANHRLLTAAVSSGATADTAITLRDLTLQGTVFTKGYNGGIAYFSGVGDVVIDHVTFDGAALVNGTCYGGGIYFEKMAGDITITDSTFVNLHSCHGGGGAIYVLSTNPEAAEFTVSGSVFERNSAGMLGQGANGIITNANGDCNFGGAIAIYNKDNASMFNLQVVIEDSTFTGNSASVNGGAIYSRNADSFYVNNCEFTDNFALTSGGAIYVDSALPDDVTQTEAVIENSLFHRNVAKNGGGGGVWMNAAYDSGVYDSVFTENEAYKGGGISFSGPVKTGQTASVRLSHLVLDSNYAVLAGGGVFTSAHSGNTGSTFSSMVMMDHLIVVNNRAGVGGGGIAVGHTNQKFSNSIVNCTIVGNTVDFAHGSRTGLGAFAYTGGAGIGAANYSTTSLSTYFGNSGYNGNYPTMEVVNSLVVGNDSGLAGGYGSDDIFLMTTPLDANPTITLNTDAYKYSTYLSFYSVYGTKHGATWHSRTSNGVNVGDVENNANIFADMLYNPATQVLGGKYILNNDGSLDFNISNSVAAGIINHEGLSVALIQYDGGYWYYGYKDASKGETAWTIRFHGTSSNVTGYTVMTDVNDSFVREEFELDFSDRQRIKNYTAGAVQYGEVVAWTDTNNDGVEDEVFGQVELVNILNGTTVMADGTVIYTRYGNIDLSGVTISASVVLDGSAGTLLNADGVTVSAADAVFRNMSMSITAADITISAGSVLTISHSYLEDPALTVNGDLVLVSSTVYGAETLFDGSGSISVASSTVAAGEISGLTAVNTVNSILLAGIGSGITVNAAYSITSAAVSGTGNTTATYADLFGASAVPDENGTLTPAKTTAAYKDGVLAGYEGKYIYYSTDNQTTWISVNGGSGTPAAIITDQLGNTRANKPYVAGSSHYNASIGAVTIMMEDRSLVVTTADDVIDETDFVTSLKEALIYAVELSALDPSQTITVTFSSDVFYSLTDPAVYAEFSAAGSSFFFAVMDCGDLVIDGALHDPAGTGADKCISIVNAVRDSSGTIIAAQNFLSINSTAVTLKNVILQGAGVGIEYAHGGVAFVSNGGTLIIEDSLIRGYDVAKESEALIVLQSADTITFDNVEITDNHGTGVGGFLVYTSINPAKILFVDCLVHHNGDFATGDTFGMLLDAQFAVATLTVKDSVFRDTNFGAYMFHWQYDGQALVDGSEFINVTASRSGSLFYSRYSTYGILVNDCVFTGNTLNGYGVVYSVGSVVINNTLIAGNTLVNATENSGIIQNKTDTSKSYNTYQLYLLNSTIIDNVVQSDHATEYRGAALNIAPSGYFTEIYVGNTIIVGNTRVLKDGSGAESADFRMEDEITLNAMGVLTGSVIGTHASSFVVDEETNFSGVTYRDIWGTDTAPAVTVNTDGTLNLTAFTLPYHSLALRAGVRFMYDADHVKLLYADTTDESIADGAWKEWGTVTSGVFTDLRFTYLDFSLDIEGASRGGFTAAGAFDGNFTVESAFTGRDWRTIQALGLTWVGTSFQLSDGNGNWITLKGWHSEAVPDENAMSVTIVSGSSISTGDIADAIGGLTVEYGGSIELNHSSGVTLHGINSNYGTMNITTHVELASGATFDCGVTDGNYSTTSYSGNADAILGLNSSNYGNLSLDGTFTANSALKVDGNFVLAAASTLILAATDNSWAAANATFAADSTVIYNGTGQSINSSIFGNLTVNGSATASSSLNVAGKLTVGATAELFLQGTTATWASADLKDGSTVIYSGTLNQNIASATYSNLTVSSNATAAEDLTVNGTLTVTKQLTLIGNSNFWDATKSVLDGSTIIYAGDNSAIVTDSYNNLTITKAPASASATASASGALEVNGTLTVAANVTLVLSAASGNTWNTGTFADNSTVRYTGTDAALVAGNYYNLDLAGSGTMSVTDLSVRNSLAIGSSQTLDVSGDLAAAALSNAGELILGGAFTLTNSGTTLGNVTYDGADQSVLAGTYANLTLTGSGTKTFAGNVTITGELSVSGTSVTDYITVDGGSRTLTLGAAYGGSADAPVTAITNTHFRNLTVAGATLYLNGASNSAEAVTGLNVVLTVVTAPTASEVLMGDTLAESTLTGGEVSAARGSVSVTGSFSWSDPATVPYNGQAYGVSFVSTDGIYIAACQVSIKVNERPSTIVTTLNDVIDSEDSQISLREAIGYAGTNSLGTVITFAENIFDAGAILTLTSNLVLNKAITINGDLGGGKGAVTLSAGSGVEVVINAGAYDITLENVKLNGGKVQATTGVYTIGAGVGGTAIADNISAVTKDGDTGLFAGTYTDLTVSGSGTKTVSGDLTVTGDLVSTGNLAVSNALNAADISNGTGKLSAISITAASVTGNAGTIETTGALTLTGDLANSAEVSVGGKLTAQTISAGTALSAAEVEGVSLSNDGGAVSVTNLLKLSGALTNISGSLTAGSVEADSATNGGTVSVTNGMALTGDLVNTKDVTVGGALSAANIDNGTGALTANSITATALTANNGTVDVTNDMALTGDLVNTKDVTVGGALSAANISNGDGKLSASAITATALTANNGTVSVTNDMILTGDLANTKDVTVGGALSAANISNGDGKLSASAITATALTANNGTVDVTNDMTLTGDLANSAEVSVGGALSAANIDNGTGALTANSITATALTANNGTVDVTNDMTLTGDLANTKDVTVGGALSAANIDNGTGALTANSITATALTANNGTVDVTNDMTLTGDLANTKDVTVGGALSAANISNGDGKLSASAITATALTANNGTVDVTNDMALTGDLVNTKDVTVGGALSAANIDNGTGALTANSITAASVTGNAGTIETTGALTLTGDLANSAEVSVGGKLTAQTISAGTALSAAEVEGVSLSNDGGTVSVTNLLKLSGALTNTSGSLTAGSVEADSATNGGTVDVTNDMILTGDLANSKDVTVGGALSAANISNGDGKLSASAITATALTANNGTVDVTNDMALTGDLVNTKDVTVGGALSAANISNGDGKLSASAITATALTANNGTVDVTNDMTLTGDLANTKDVTVGGALSAANIDNGTGALTANSITAAALTANNGTVDVTNDMTLTGDLANSKDVTVGGMLNAANISNGDGKLSASAITATALTANNGTVDVTNDMTLTGDLANSKDVTVGGALSAANISNGDGKLSASEITATALTANNGTVYVTNDMALTGDLVNTKDVTVGGALSAANIDNGTGALTANSITATAVTANAGSIEVANDMKLTGDLANTAEVSVGGKLTAQTISAGTALSAAEVEGVSLSNDGGAVSVTNLLKLSGALTNISGSLTAGSVEADSATNGGTVSVTNLLKLSGALTNTSGSLTAGSVEADSATNGGTVSVTNDMTLTGDLANSKDVTVGGALSAANIDNGTGALTANSITATAVTANAGSIEVANDMTLTGDLANSKDVTVGGALSAANIDNGTGKLSASAITATALTANNGTVDVTNDMILTADLANTKDVTVGGALSAANISNGDGKLSASAITATALTANNGTVDVTNDMTLTGDLANTKDITVGGALSAANISNGDGKLSASEITATALTANNGTVDVTNDMTLTGDLANSKDVTVGGALSAAGIQNAGTLEAAGIEGVSLDNSGTVEVAGTTTLTGDAVNSGQLTAHGSLTVGGAFSNSGTVQLFAAENSWDGSKSDMDGAVSYAGADQSVVADDYQDLTIGGEGVKLFAAGSTTGVSGTFRVDGGSDYSAPLTLDSDGVWELDVTGSVETFRNVAIRNSSAVTALTVDDSNVSLGGNSGWTIVLAVPADLVLAGTPIEEGDPLSTSTIPAFKVQTARGETLTGTAVFTDGEYEPKASESGDAFAVTPTIGGDKTYQFNVELTATVEVVSMGGGADEYKDSSAKFRTVDSQNQENRRMLQSVFERIAPQEEDSRMDIGPVDYYGHDSDAMDLMSMDISFFDSNIYRRADIFRDGIDEDLEELLNPAN